MDQLCRILRRNHCRSNHHRFAIDALSHVETDAGKRLRSWLLRYYPRYLQGAVDPDERFRDYHNHVLHIHDGSWGGAVRVAHQWYHRLKKHLRREEFSDAAHAAGVLGHYVSDVIQPLHTISSQREALIHRPLEWSVDRCYGKIVKHIHRHQIQVDVTLPQHAFWLGSLMLHTANHASTYAAHLTDRYQFENGIRRPKQSLDTVSLDTLAELITLSWVSIAKVIDRVATETEQYTGYDLPECGLKLTTIHAFATSPAGRLRSTIRNHVEKRRLRSMINEYTRDGKLVQYLPPEIDIKQRVIEVYHKERSSSTFRQRAA
ncbi:hypothetical protein LOC67_09955 [Stieleria sp. JC731]|uniref:hypothetical protein n=1 Tax=Pirellulaceae TaxID=2691357 RepID=UPI001E647C3F|nr:hypothetical protein [Stieleria sp. JC731]MCC9600890.1 hypothetical protein [Stieleria sp. JC731]